MIVLLSKCRLGLILFISIVVMACTSNAEKLATVSTDITDHCSEISEFSLPHAVITQAQSVAAGDFVNSDSCWWLSKSADKW